LDDVKEVRPSVLVLCVTAVEIFFEVLADGGYKQLIARMEKSGVLQNMSSFCADVVAKIDRA
jgi:hypothetical protein